MPHSSHCGLMMVLLLNLILSTLCDGIVTGHLCTLVTCEILAQEILPPCSQKPTHCTVDQGSRILIKDCWLRILVFLSTRRYVLFSISNLTFDFWHAQVNDQEPCINFVAEAQSHQYQVLAPHGHQGQRSSCGCGDIFSGSKVITWLCSSNDFSLYGSERFLYRL